MLDIKNPAQGVKPNSEFGRLLSKNMKIRKPTQRAEDAEKAVSKVTEGGSKTKYFTDNLSKLDRNKRKLVQQIMVIVRRIVSKEVADQIQEAIEKEFR